MIYRIEWTRTTGRITRFDFGSRQAAEQYAAGLTTGTTRIIELS